MKEIKLNKGLVTLVDDEDYEWLNQWHWLGIRVGTRYYAMRVTQKNYKKKYIYMHRLIMGEPKGMQVDHIDHNGLNNQRDNLRICTHQQNNFNKKPRGEINYSGVVKNNLGHGRGKGYKAGIKINGRRKHLGVYENEIDAARAYDRAAKKLFGEFANLNFRDNEY